MLRLLEKDYFFGTHDPNRIKFTTARDIVLEPGQKGEPLNYFIYPYVEVDGVPHEDRTLRFGFRDLWEPVRTSYSKAGCNGCGLG